MVPQSAEQGLPDAQTSLGELCANGEGTRQDDIEAVRWFRAAAEQGHARAQADLGRMYEHGRGVPRDLVEAYKWFSLSAAGGHPAAPSLLSDLAKRLSPAQSAEGIKRADAWSAQHKQ